jgi:transcriptional regulatory protein LevR
MKENSIINKQAAEQIVVESLKKRKCIERVEISTVEQKNEIWVVRGTCPIDMEGHPWAEKFEVTVDTRGRIKSIDLALL